MSDQHTLFLEALLALDGDPLQTPQELADELGVTVRTLEGWRYRKKGPGWIRLGGNGPVRYPRSLKLPWLARSANNSIGEA